MIKQINIDDLDVDMYVEKVDRSWLEIPFFRKDIKSFQQIEKLRKYHVKVLYINTEKGKDVGQKAVRPPTGVKEVREKPAIIDPPSEPLFTESLEIFDRQEVQVCEALQKQAVQCVKEIFQSFDSGGPPDIKSANEVVDVLVNNMGRYPDILISLSKLKTFDDYTFLHSVNVSIFSLTIGESLNYTKSELKTLGMGALFHDIGKTRIPKEVLNRPGPLKPEDLPLIRKHPIDSVDLLRETPGINPDCFSIPLEHHERISGSGYPKGLKGAKISEFGMISSIADVYDAMTSNRVYSKKVQPYTALSEIYSMTKKDFHAGLVEKFITRIGIYPIGSLVILTSGEVGVVIEIHREKLLCPVVLLLFDQGGAAINPPDAVDLMYDKKKRRIKSVTSPEKFGINLEKLL